jgi:protein O-GlcNAc transferase
MDGTLKNPTLVELLARGATLHEAGDFLSAEANYMQILQEQPNHPEANHNLAILFTLQGKLECALDHLKICLNASPNVNLFWATYIDVLVKLGRISDAQKLLNSAKDNGLWHPSMQKFEEHIASLHFKPSENDFSQLEKLIASNEINTARQVCSNLIKKFPGSGRLNHYLGQCFLKGNDIISSINAYEKVVQFSPNWYLGFMMLGHLNLLKKNENEAIENFKQAINLKPDDAEARLILVDLLLERKDSGTAIHYLEDTLKDNITCSRYLCALAKSYEIGENIDSAIDFYERAFAVDANNLAILNKIGGLHWKNNKPNDAAIAFERAIEIDPCCTSAVLNIAFLMCGLGDYLGALKKCNDLLELRPNFIDAELVKGKIFIEAKNFSEAEKSFKKVYKISPTCSEAWEGLGDCLYGSGDAAGAVRKYKAAAKLNPKSFKSFLQLGLIRMQKGHYSTALKCLKRAEKIKPDSIEVLHIIGQLYQSKGGRYYKDAMRYYDKVLIIDPDHSNVLAAKLHLHALTCDWDEIEKLRSKLPSLGTSEGEVLPFSLLALEDAPARHKIRAERYCARNFFPGKLSNFVVPSVASKKLKIGYFSGDFHLHPVSILISAVLESHSQNDFEIYAYSLGNERDAMYDRISKIVHKFKDVSKFSEIEIARLARRDGIDIAIDLSGYTRGGRPQIFAHRAAPIQVSYLGFPGSMGSNFIDYIIVDKNLVPPENQKYYSEKPIYLPRQYQAQDSSLSLEKPPSKQQLGLPEDAFIFCAINNTYKITSAEFDIWMRLLSRVEGSVLWLFAPNELAKENLIKHAGKRGISSDRLVFAKKLSFIEYVDQLSHADLYLDTFNYNAGATASNVLWAGVPLITKAGVGYSARMASSLLQSIGMPELITKTPEDYEALALNLAKNPVKLSAIRLLLSLKCINSELFDVEAFTGDLENSYRKIYQRYVEGKKPDVIYVER